MHSLDCHRLLTTQFSSFSLHLHFSSHSTIHLVGLQRTDDMFHGATIKEAVKTEKTKGTGSKERMMKT